MLLPDGDSVGVRPGAIVVIGRESPDARIAGNLAQYDGVSRRHAQLAVEDTGVTLVDIGSTNGTRVDGLPVSRVPLTLGPGEHQVHLGKTAVVVIDVVAGGQA
ncbi:FHA domain-containing protein [Kribbella sp. CA-245084]|uniref:FHA domain-containing protein n=1 Tax=Kribbella sp. CA-245084 TaxID=3239940 RepID=UPI003D8F6E9E